MRIQNCLILKNVFNANACFCVEAAEQQASNKTKETIKMAYKKPEIVAKSESKQSFVAGCPTRTCHMRCQYGQLA